MLLTSILPLFGGDLFSLTGGIWSVIGVVGIFLVKKYLVPFLSVEKRRRYAEWIVRIADEIIAELMAKYPEKKWLSELDQAIDLLMEICGIDRPTAERAIKAAASRKS